MIRSGSAPVSEGDLLAGKYRVERVLGAGGMGIVVAARHEQLDQLVAIKFVREEALSSEDAVQRFLREARAAVKLKSEHVARVLDVGKLESGAPYMVMEYLEGNDLAKVLGDHGVMPVDTAADWIMQACEAVAEAHGLGIVHRDLKPENLFLTHTVGGAQKIKVLDFGVSKAIGGASGEMSSLTRTRAMLGSPLYMAPEQMRSSRDVDARADVWALGVVLFQLLTQRWPFEAETMPELCLKVVMEPPMPLAEVRPDAPPGIAEVIATCLEKDPTKRYANAAELASALEPFVQPGSRMLAERARLAMSTKAGAYGSLRQTPSGTLQSQTPASALGPNTPAASLRANTPAASVRANTPAASMRANTPAASQRANTPPAPSVGGRTPGSLPDGRSPAPSFGSLTPASAPRSTPPSGTGGPRTPGTSAGWGAERVATPQPEGARGSSSRLLIGIAVAAVMAVGGILLLARGPASTASAGPASPVGAESVLPSAAVRGAPQEAPSAPDSQHAAAEGTVAASAGSAMLVASSNAPSTAPPGTALVAPSAGPAAPQTPVVPSPAPPPAHAPAVAHGKPAAPAHAPVPGKPAPTDDDLPTIR